MWTACGGCLMRSASLPVRRWSPVLERFRKATQREPLYQCISMRMMEALTESYGLMFE